MASATAASSTKEPGEFPDEFCRIVYMVNELRGARKSSPLLRDFPKLFLAGYFTEMAFNQKLLKCFRELPKRRSLSSPPPEEKKSSSSDKSTLDEREVEQLKNVSDDEVEKLVTQIDHMNAESGKVKKGFELTPDELRGLLTLLQEVACDLEIGTIDKAARADILRLLMLIVGRRYDVISRVLYYLYQPRGRFEEEKISDPPVLGDTKIMYPNENLAFSLVFDVRAVLDRDKFARYLSLWENVQKQIVEGTYGTRKSKDTLGKISGMLKPYPNLMRKLTEVPWPHYIESEVIRKLRRKPS